MSHAGTDSTERSEPQAGSALAPSSCSAVGVDVGKSLIKAVLVTGGENPFYPDAGYASMAFAIVGSGAFFENPFYAEAWEALIQIHTDGKNPINVTSLASELLDSERDYRWDNSAWSELLDDLGDATSEQAQNWRYYAQEVKSAYIQRRMRQSAAELADNPSLSAINSMASEFERISKDEEDSRADGRAAIARLIETQQANFEKPGIKGARTGIEKLDQCLGGLQGGRVTIMGARPSIGKTAAAVSMVSGLLEHGERVEFISLEMSETEIATRLVACRARVGYAEASYQTRPSEAQNFKIQKAMRELYDAPIAINAPEQMTIAEAAEAIRKAGADGASVVFLDYIGLLRPDSKTQRDNRYILLTEASVAMKAAARRAGVNLVLLAQVGRGADKSDTTPKLSDLRESGQIEQDADAVIFISRPDKEEEDVENEDCLWVIAKQRNGPTGALRMNFCRQTMTFSEASEY